MGDGGFGKKFIVTRADTGVSKEYRNNEIYAWGRSGLENKIYRDYVWFGVEKEFRTKGIFSWGRRGLLIKINVRKADSGVGNEFYTKEILAWGVRCLKK